MNYKKPSDMLFICLRIITGCFLLPEEQQDVREAFLAINVSDSGEITKQELLMALPDLEEHDATLIINNAC